MKKRYNISEDRALQISNNCSEEYIDLGQTNFATKAELCETILWTHKHWLFELGRKDAALDEMIVILANSLVFHIERGDATDTNPDMQVIGKLMTIASKARIYEDKPNEKPSARPRTK